MKKKEEMVLALAKEMELRKNESQNELVETIYFGGGTPSVLSIDDIRFLIDSVYKHYQVAENPEITLEANPDDLDNETILQYANSPINRLSIGVQSFFEDDLQLMNRAHNSAEAKKCLEFATQHFDNISIDLIYGMPNMSNQKWLQNIETALSFNIPHISSYALTVEPKTALHKMIKTGAIPTLDDDVAQQHFHILIDTLQENGLVHYELSNFGKPDYFSKNNTAYWLGKKYIGIGPSAHSYNGESRSWNVANNALYLKAIAENKLPSETEILSKTDQYNEYIMTGLRTIWGVSLERVTAEFGTIYLEYLQKQSEKYILEVLLEIVTSSVSMQHEEKSIEKNVLKTTKKGKFLSDGIASDLFLLNLK